MKRKWITVLAIAGLVVVTAAPITVLASESDRIEESSSAASSFSEEFGVSVEDAALYLNDQQTFGLFLTHLEEAGHIVEAWIDNTESKQTFNLRVNDKIDTKGLRLSHLSEVVIHNQALITEEELQFISEVVSDYQELGLFELAGYYVDTETGALILDVVSSRDSKVFSDLQEELQRPVEPHVVEGDYGDGAAFSGGAAMASCTAGFTAKYGTAIGVLGAAHCNNQTLYNLPVVGGSSAFVTKTTSVYNANADIAFFQLPNGHTITNLFYQYPTFATQNLAHVTIANGSYVCSYGKSTGYRCGNVDTINYKPLWSGACGTVPCNNVFVRVATSSTNGDSGGPWWSGNGRVQGIHKGHVSSHSVFSRIQNRPASTFVNY